MKTALLIIGFIIPVIVSGQKITRDENDKFLKVRFVETSWEPLKVKFVNAIRFRCKSIDGKKYIETILTFHDVFRVDEGDRMYFLFNDSVSIHLECDRGEVARYHYSKYGSYWSCNARYPLTDEIIKHIESHELVAIRVGIADEYYIFDEIKDKNSTKLRRAISLISR